MAADRATSAAEISDSPRLKVLAKALTSGALPGEVADFGAADRKAAAALMLAALDARRGADAEIRIESGTSSDGRRLMRVAVVNDDMPFLVDSIANAITARGLPIDRILHPIAGVVRDKSGHFSGLDAKGARTSLIYMETERGDALLRKSLEAAIADALHHVRAAVTDWAAMKTALADEAVPVDQRRSVR
jgi:glutamate dehydrogenase